MCRLFYWVETVFGDWISSCVPAGTFKAYRLELNSISEWGERVKLTRWMQPDWGFAIKTLREIRGRTGAPTLETIEMVSRERGPG